MNYENRHIERQAPAPDPDPVRTRRRKNTRKWCKGIEGREHTPEIVEAKWTTRECRDYPQHVAWWLKKGSTDTWWCQHQRACSQCGKILDYFLEPAECPDRSREGQ